MPSALERLAEFQFQGGGSQSQSMQFLVLCAAVVGEITQDEQLLGIAAQLGAENGGAGQGGARIPQGFLNGARSGPPLQGPQGQPPQPQPQGPQGLVGAP